MKTADAIVRMMYGDKKDMYLGTYTLSQQQIVDCMTAYGKEILDEVISVPSEIYWKQLKENLP